MKCCKFKAGIWYDEDICKSEVLCVKLKNSLWIGCGTLRICVSRMYLRVRGYLEGWLGKKESCVSDRKIEFI